MVRRYKIKTNVRMLSEFMSNSPIISLSGNPFLTFLNLNYENGNVKNDNTK